jgi:archaetidylinositol phosphate synthase
MSEGAKGSFTGDKKLPMTTLLAGVERKFIDANVTGFPRWIEGYHLTLMTIPWSAGLILFGWLAAKTGNLHWLWLSSLMMILQWFTDCFDGALGRHRDTGIPKWGFYMDHLLDFVFMAATLMGYAFLLQGHDRALVHGLIPVFATFMVSSFLSFGATGQFKITYMGTGPTEIRIGFVVLNTALTLFGTQWVPPLLPYILGVSIFFLCVIVFRTQKYIWAIDMADKRARTQPGPRDSKG